MPDDSSKLIARCTWRVLTPHSAGGAAIAIIELRGDVDWALEQLGIAQVDVGSFALRNCGGLDRGVVARWSIQCAHLMPHGGAALLSQTTLWLDRSGVHHEPLAEFASETCVNLRSAFPEARSDVEALAIATLPHVASPGAIDLILRQHALWQGHNLYAPRTRSQSERDRVLARLLSPPLIVIAGVPNVGKSRLMNALAGQTISIVSELPGTTRDHVGIHAICGSVAVRLVDTPGLRSTTDPIESEAQSTAHAFLGSADLVIACSDPEHPAPSDLAVHCPHATIIPIRTKSDLFGPDPDAAFSVSAATGEGITSLAVGLGELLIPQAVRDLPLPWRFW